MARFNFTAARARALAVARRARRRVRTAAGSAIARTRAAARVGRSQARAAARRGVRTLRNRATAGRRSIQRRVNRATGGTAVLRARRRVTGAFSRSGNNRAVAQFRRLRRMTGGGRTYNRVVSRIGTNRNRRGM